VRHLLRSWDEVRRRIAGRDAALFLDFDGTLAPIARTPAGASLPPETRALLRRLAAAPGVSVAIVSGRSLRDVRRRVGLRGIVYAGCHGLEIEGPRMRRAVFASRKGRAAVARIRRALSRAAGRIPGALIEDKGCSFALHYRLVAAGNRPRVKALLRDAAADSVARGAVRVKRGKMVLEVLPPADWDKGSAVLWIEERLRRRGGARGLVPVYIGDDLTDEAAFRSFRRRGITARVGGARRSHARYRLRDTREVAGFLGLVLAERSRSR
jgi:trehalose-phosphatase